MTYLVQYEGVLMNGETPILQGFQLIQSLAQMNRVLLMTDGTEERVAHQLRTERLQDQIAEIIDQTVHLEPLPLWKRQIEVARSRAPIAYVVTAQPHVAEYAVEHSLVSLFFAHPGYSRPALRPEQGNRSWEDLTAELAARWD